MPVMIIAFNPVNLNSIYVKTSGLFPGVILRTQKHKVFGEKVVKGSCHPPPPWVPSNILQQGMNKAENGFVQHTMAHR